MDDKRKKHLQNLFIEALEEAKQEEDGKKPDKPLSKLGQEKLAEYLLKTGQLEE